MKRKNKRVDHRDHVADLLKNPPSDPSSLPLEEMKRRFDKMLEELRREWKTVKPVGRIYVRRL